MPDNMSKLFSICFLLMCVFPTGCRQRQSHSKDEAGVKAVLDDWHRAASEADEKRYIGHMMPDGVFLGTDATERWSTSEFREFVRPHFLKGNGWTYEAANANVIFSQDGQTAWFDERLFNEKYGELRGTGVLCRVENNWKIAQYNMSFPLPNDLTKKIVKMIKASDSGLQPAP